MEKFEPGDIVQLKSGGPRMTVEYLDFHQTQMVKQGVVCSWFEGDNHKTERFAMTSLRKV